jgi:hypothetical protein
MPTPQQIDAFIENWRASGTAEESRSERITELLETLVSLGQARQEGTEFVER